MPCYTALGYTMLHYTVLFYSVVTWTAFPYHTLHRQPTYPDNRHRPNCMLYCVGRLAVVSPNNLRCYCVIRPCARVSLLFYSRVPKTLEHSRSLKFTVRVMSRI